MIDPKRRQQIALAVAYGCRRWFTEPVDIHETSNTSGCPVVTVTIDGQAYNVTITKARKKP